MMLIIKISIFCFLILSVKVMFSLFFQDEDTKLYRMKEAADFIEYLRVYSCSMKMSLEEIISKYNFKNNAVKYIENYEVEYKERKNLLNKLSLLVGCLIAIVLI